MHRRQPEERSVAMVYLLEYLRPRWRRFLKALCLYGLAPALLLWLLAGLIAGAARSGISPPSGSFWRRWPR